MFVVVGPGEQSVSLLQCQQVANELRETMRRAAHLHQQVNFLSDWLYVAAPVKSVRIQQFVSNERNEFCPRK